MSASIDLSKIDKTRIVEGKNGGKYFNITIILNDTKDQYGNDVSVQVGQTKEERSAKTKAVYLGNGRLIYSSSVEEEAGKNPIPPVNSSSDNDDLPF